MLLKLAYQYT